MDAAASLLIDNDCMKAGSPDMARAAGVTGYRAGSDPKGIYIF